jgi:hypothetical protein
MTAIVPDSQRAAATARQLRKLASWCIPALTTALTVAFFYLLSTRSPLIVRPVGLHGIPAGSPQPGCLATQPLQIVPNALPRDLSAKAWYR